MSRATTQAKVAQQKREHPEQFCPDARCLWRTGGGYCPRHAQLPPGFAAQQGGSHGVSNK